MKTILIVDDHPLVRAGFASILESEPDLKVIGRAGSIQEALAAVRKEQPDLAIIDLSLSDGSGLDLIKRLKIHYPKLKMLACSMHDESLFAQRAINAGALGYVNKLQVTDHVVDAVRQALAGKIYLSAEMVERVVNRFAKKNETETSSVADLTDRELEIFGMIGQALSTARIAERLHLSVKTVETHREKIKRKLQLTSGAELAIHAAQWRLEQSGKSTPSL